MAEEEYHGIPRSKIHWNPIIDHEKCVVCGTGVDYCKLGLFEFEEKEEKKRPVVKNPNNCVIFCTDCEKQCTMGAIKFPCKKETREAIKKLAEAKNLKQSKTADLHERFNRAN